MLSKQILSKTPTEFRYIERSVFVKKVNNPNVWNFEVGSQESTNKPIWIIIRIQQRERQNTQIWNQDTFCRLPLTSAQSIFVTENYPDVGILLQYVV